MVKTNERVPAHRLTTALLMLSLAIATTAACHPQPQPPIAPTDEPDAAAPATCGTWCKHARDLACAAAKPTARGASCEDVCGNVQTGPAKWDLHCRSIAKTCAAADACE